jgi:hypothetical protein
LPDAVAFQQLVAVIRLMFDEWTGKWSIARRLMPEIAVIG